jgi:hypothetical protein
LQQDLKLQFKHVDDSLFALSLRNPKAEDITKEIGMYITICGWLVYPKYRISHQQYAVSSANKLGDFLSDILNNMQMSLSSMVLGNLNLVAGGMQLPDIIKSSRCW